MQKSLLVAFGCCVFVHVLGCSVASRPDYAALGLVQIAGTLTMDGAPLPGVEVQFHNREDSTYSSGRTDTSGRYALMFDSDTPGVIPGKKQVVLVAGASNSEESTEGGSEQLVVGESIKKASAVVLPSCYGTESKVEVDVQESNSKFDIDFKSDCSTVGR
jgi:hypothetical protein